MEAEVEIKESVDLNATAKLYPDAGGFLRIPWAITDKNNENPHTQFWFYWEKEYPNHVFHSQYKHTTDRGKGDGRMNYYLIILKEKAAKEAA